MHIKHRHSIIWNTDTLNSNTCLVLGSSLQTWIQVESTCSGNTDVETKLYKLKRNFIPFLQWRSHNHKSSLSQILTFIIVRIHLIVSFCVLSLLSGWNSGNNMNIEQQHQYMIAGYKTWTWWSYLTSTFSIFYYGGEHINSQTTSKQVSTRCESTLSCCYLNATFIIRCIHRIFYYYCYFTKNNLDIVLYVSICTSIYTYFVSKTTYIKWILNCSYRIKTSIL